MGGHKQAQYFRVKARLGGGLGISRASKSTQQKWLSGRGLFNHVGWISAKV